MKIIDVYEDKGVAQKEMDRLREFSYPFIVSKKVIGEDINGKLILDIGSGPNTELGLWIEKNGGSYIAFDKQKKFLDIQDKSGLGTMQGDILSYEFDSLSSDITHARFLLIHIPSEKHDDVIRKILSASREKALFLEFDWSAFENGGPLTSKFYYLALKFLGHKSDPFLGAKLAQKIHNVCLEEESRCYSRFVRFRRKKDAYYHEIIPLIRSMIAGMRALQLDGLKDTENLLEMVEFEAKKENPEKFVPPDIVAVTVFRNNSG